MDLDDILFLFVLYLSIVAPDLHGAEIGLCFLPSCLFFNQCMHDMTYCLQVLCGKFLGVVAREISLGCLLR
jgi:hypothetical protein